MDTAELAWRTGYKEPSIRHAIRLARQQGYEISWTPDPESLQTRRGKFMLVSEPQPTNAPDLMPAVVETTVHAGEV